MVVSPGFWDGRRVFLTGHTGFKGGWLALWLRELGAEVHGYALPANTSPALWQVAHLQGRLSSTLGDIRDAHALAATLAAFRPELVLHLAAQPLVRESYRTPADTYATNVMGTLNLLEAVRRCESVRAVVVVTSDKCYDNREWQWPYREQDALGGHDPYSSSKACTELLCASWRESFLREAGVALATARAGNVLGGGDWSADRLVPDVLRAWQRGETLTLRYPHAVRPWQHVLEPLHGYLCLARALLEQGDAMAAAWNFGPDAEGVVTVAELVAQMARLWPGESRWLADNTEQPHEAGLLSLDSSLARRRLGWRPRWALGQALERTLDWHRAWIDGNDMQAFSRAQIAAYQGETDE
ncbi:CDP-glucose 4,6-dehydratase [Stutzerimonas kirkiae]|uniref:CDP-glucose 4,6-dehydratase n=1 Tax=Stutzerimonas kirkiae TaxID=2211392 RepID=A0A4Q9RE28_9GAMM|nr:CDP-glucose 4,6-dehydratase [Stutzerimonas kirkiae]TBU99973.1 CDP-glucose 4,6-dehydratase [Stutzerimonas kirkiae]TBV05679.1 CDP-glucose 4,6-dehydratase [Stutzerimonas kirkiae]TBV10578.1 CDP-glucose 4,6-dehydratase [Stutzerimonas kirkiae]TBV17436.1 CDP-glucose 4,6-dehydratase [Stutzerimonas kirkiae]